MTIWLVCRICVNNLHHRRANHHYRPHYDHLYEIINTLEVHEPMRVWVTVATPPAHEEVRVWSGDYPSLWFVAPHNNI